MFYLLMLGFVLFFLLLLCLPLRIKVTYHYHAGGSKLSFCLQVLGASFHLEPGKRYPIKTRDRREDRREKPINLATFICTWKKWKGYIKLVLPPLKRFFSRSKIDISQLCLKVGTGNAAETGIIVGLLWGGIGLIGPLLFPRVKFAPRITPVYNRQVLNIYFSGILEVGLVHIITVVVGMLMSLLGEKYSRKGEEFSGGTSNPGLNANCPGKY
ncbi:MAG: DUF2953 domain-containing protein [Firmicutes bacterium]|nr:DUF2953 domain-containing protein [Bacillota bacterium]